MTRTGGGGSEGLSSLISSKALSIVQLPSLRSHLLEVLLSSQVTRAWDKTFNTCIGDTCMICTIPQWPSGNNTKHSSAHWRIWDRPVRPRSSLILSLLNQALSSQAPVRIDVQGRQRLMTSTPLLWESTALAKASYNRDNLDGMVGSYSSCF